MRTRASIMIGLLVAALAVVFFAGTALAQEDPYEDVGPDIHQRFGPDVADDTQERGQTPPASEGTLPFTGADLTLFLATGLAAIGTGTVIVRRARSAERS